MKPAYQNPLVSLYVGDCRDVLKEIRLAEVSTVITDPPWPNVTEEATVLFHEVCQIISGVPRLAVHLGCDSDPRFLRAIPLSQPFFRSVSLELVFPHCKGRLLYTGDMAYLFGKPPPSRPGAHLIPGRCLDTSSDGKQSDHPHPRKLAHVEWLVRWWSTEGDLILDPFVGSGTTALAAQRLGRRCIGIDLSRDYIDMAWQRLQRTQPAMQMGV